jgi:hypothetical protein
MITDDSDNTAVKQPTMTSVPDHASDDAPSLDDSNGTSTYLCDPLLSYISFAMNSGTNDTPDIIFQAREHCEM